MTNYEVSEVRDISDQSESIYGPMRGNGHHSTSAPLFGLHEWERVPVAGGRQELHSELADGRGLLPNVAWETAAWYWANRVPRGDFGDTIRAINGAQECGGRSPDQVQSRVNQYRRISNLLGVGLGDNLSC